MHNSHREVTTAFFSSPVMQPIRFLHALVGNDIIRTEPGTAFMSLILVFLCASQGPSLLSSAPETARLHARCGERREQNFKKLFLFVCFPGSLQPGTEKETQGVDEARRELQDMLPTLQSRYLRIPEQHGRHSAQLSAFPHKPSHPAKTLAAAPYLGRGGSVEQQQHSELHISWTSLWL